MSRLATIALAIAELAAFLLILGVLYGVLVSAPP